jgi:hypothetical protein
MAATPVQGKLLALEAKIVNDAAGDWLANVAAIKRDLAIESPDVRRRLFELVAPSIEVPLSNALLDAFAIGRESALETLGKDHPNYERAESKTARSTPRALDAVTGLDAKLSDSLSMAKRLATAGATDETAFAPIFAASNSLTRTSTWAINDAGNEGVIEVADVAVVSLVWVAEFDACVECLAYSGQVAGPGDSFPGGLTFGEVLSAESESLPGPPLHPNCRCTVEILADPSYASALRRESIRSVLRGFSLPSESMGVRVDAAERLLATNPTAPKSVIKVAETAVKAGEFKTRGRP